MKNNMKEKTDMLKNTKKNNC